MFMSTFNDVQRANQFAYHCEPYAQLTGPFVDFNLSKRKQILSCDN